MKKIILVRHGKSQGNAREAGGKDKDSYINDCEIGLAKGAEEKIELLAGKLENYLKDIPKEEIELWISPFKRTRQTAEIINNTLKINNVYEDPRIVEQDYGDFDFQFFEDYFTISPHAFFINQMRYFNPHARFWAKVENGESFADVYNRISLFDISRCQNNPKTQILVTHGCFILAALMYYMGEKVEFVYTFDKHIENASAFVLEKIENSNLYKLTDIL